MSCFLLFTFLLYTPFKYLSYFIFPTASAVLRCWRCSTDVSNGEFCNDPFQPDSISEQQRYWSYVNCTYSVGVKSVNARPVCKKLVQEGESRVGRRCLGDIVAVSAETHRWVAHTRLASAAACCCLPQSVKQD